MEDRLNEIKGIYKVVQDAKKRNNEVYSRIKTNFNSARGSIMNNYRNYSIRKVDFSGLDSGQVTQRSTERDDRSYLTMADQDIDSVQGMDTLKSRSRR